MYLNGYTLFSSNAYFHPWLMVANVSRPQILSRNCQFADSSLLVLQSCSTNVTQCRFEYLNVCFPFLALMCPLWRFFLFLPKMQHYSHISPSCDRHVKMYKCERLYIDMTCRRGLSFRTQYWGCMQENYRTNYSFKFYSTAYFG